MPDRWPPPCPRCSWRAACRRRRDPRAIRREHNRRVVAGRPPLGTIAQQCIEVTDTGFTVAIQQSVGNTSGAPASCLGCHCTRCFPGTDLPMRVGDVSGDECITYRCVPGATYDAAYGIRLDSAPKTDGVSRQEIMIRFHRRGSIQPVGSVVRNATIGVRAWQVREGSNGANAVVSYVARSSITGCSFSALDFIRDVQNRGVLTDSWYSTSIRVGFERWIGGAGPSGTIFTA